MLWKSKTVEAWFTGSYWGFSKTLLRNVTRSAIEQVWHSGIPEVELPLNGHLTMICVMTQRPNQGRAKTYLTHEQLRGSFPNIFNEFVKQGVIPTSYRAACPQELISEDWNKEMLIPTFVEIYVPISRATVTFEDEWILRLFAPYWDHSEHHLEEGAGVIRAVLYNGEDRVPVQILVSEIQRSNQNLFEVLRQFFTA